MSETTIRRRLRAGRWGRVYPGVFLHGGAPVTWKQEATAAYLWAGDDSALCGRTAAAWWGIGGFAPALPIEVVMRYHRKPPTPDIVVRQTSCLGPGDVEMHGPVAVTSIVRTLFDLCAECPMPRVRAAISDALRQGLTNFPSMWKCLDVLAASGRNGTRLFRHLLATMDEGAGVTESMLECAC